MRNIPHYLNDEHMKLYEWSGAATGFSFSLPAKSKRTHPWHASYAVLAALTSLLILNGCISNPSAKQTSEQDALDFQQKKAPPHDTKAAQPVPVEAAGPAAEGSATNAEQDASDCSGAG